MPFALAAIVSLAIGIGANTAVFTLVNDVLLRSLPVRNPDELVLFRLVEGRDGRISRSGENNGSIDPVTGRPASTSFSLATFKEFQAHHPALADVFAFAPFNQIHLLIDGQPEAGVLGQLVSGRYYSTLGVSAALGRVLNETDDTPSAEPVTVLSHRYWETRFGADSSVVGKVIYVNRVAVTIVGVAQRGFAGAMQVGESADISLPLSLHLRFQPDRASRAQPWYWWIRVMGRLSPGATPAQVSAALEPILQTTARAGWLAGSAMDAEASVPMPAAPTLVADPGGQGENDARRRYRQSLNLLTGIVALVLVAACANVANLLIARGAARRREIAMRLALGASRARIVGQLLAESAVLAGLGGALGTLLAYGSRGLLVALKQFGGSPVMLDQPLDRRVFAFTIGIAAVTVLVFGLVPALRATRLNLSTEFQGGVRQLGAGARSRLSQGLIVLQIAVSLTLLVGTGLFVKTLGNLQSVDPGFNPENLLMFKLDANAAGYPRDQIFALYGRIQERLATIPGVSGATFSNVALLSGTRSNRRVVVRGYTPAPGESLNINTNGMARNFLQTVGIPLLAGRYLNGDETRTSPMVAIVNVAFARQFFHVDNPVGNHFSFSARPGDSGNEVEIVGVAKDARYTGVREASPATIYLPAVQLGDPDATFYVRTVQEPAAQIAAIQRAVHDVDPSLPIINLRTEQEQISRISSQEQLFARLSAFFGVIALALACVGIYGLMSYMVIRRGGEIGLRMALGALPAQMLRLVLRESAVLISVGVALGLACAYGATRFVQAMLYGISPTDPYAYGAASLALVCAAILSSAIPAMRAARVDPMTALRTE